VYKDIKLNNSVFDLSRYKRVKWWNIPGHIKRFVHMGKALYRRGKYGFTPLDVWNLHYYLSEHISNLLIFLKNNGQGYPIYFQQQHPDDEEAGFAAACAVPADELRVRCACGIRRQQA